MYWLVMHQFLLLGYLCLERTELQYGSCYVYLSCMCWQNSVIILSPDTYFHQEIW